ncbi:MAG: DUF2282 domain-containing protein [Rhodospirillaceae bacterium]|nr:MAG: DUF2282 domain-containing protein [Rhodospirillaceae bacterium]
MQSTKLTHAALLAAVVGATVAFTSSGAKADDAKPGMAMEKCFGIAKAGENSCAAKNGNHSCAGQSKTSYSGQEFKAIPAGTCDKMMGSLTPFDGMNPKIKG